MARQDFELFFKIRDGFTAGLRAISDAFDAIGKKLVFLNQGAELISKAFEVIKSGFGFGKLISEAGSFEAALKRVQAVTGATTEDLDALKKSAEEASLDFGIPVEQAAAALEGLARNGLSAADAANALGPALELAAAGAKTADEATSLLGDTMNQFGLEAKDAAEIANVFATVAIKSGVGIDQLGEAFKAVAPAARLAGLSFKDTAALVGAFAKEGITGGQAAKALAGFLDQLSQPTSKLRIELARLGDNTGDFNKALKALAAGGADADRIFADLGPKLGPALARLVAQGTGSIQELRAALDNTEGATKRLADQIDSGFDASFKKFEQSVAALGRAIGEPILKPLTDALEDARKALNEFAKTPEFDQFKDQLAAIFTEAAANVRAFLREFDLKGATAETLAFLTNAGKNLREFGQIAGTVAAGVKVAFEAVRAAFDLLDAAVSLVVASIASQAAALSAPMALLSENAEKAHDVLENIARTAAGRVWPALVGAADAASKAGAAIGDAGSASAAAAPKIESVATAAKAVKTANDEAANSTHTFKLANETLAKQQDELREAYLGVVPIIKGIGQANTEAAESIDHLTEAERRHNDELQRAQDALAAAQREYNALAQAAVAAGEKIPEATQALKDAEAAMRALVPAAKESAEETKRLNDAFAQLGIKSQKELNDAAKTATDNFEAIRAAAERGTRGIEDVRRAFEASARAQLAAVADSDEAARQQVEAQLRVQGASIGATKALESLGLASRDSAAGLDRVAGSGRGAAQAIDQVGSAAQSAVSSTDDFRASLHAVNDGSGKVTGALTQMGLVIGDVSEQFLKAATAANHFVATDPGEFTRQLNRVTDEYERQRKSLNQQLQTMREQAAATDAVSQQVEKLRHAYGLLGDQQLRQLAELQVQQARAAEQERARVIEEQRRLQEQQREAAEAEERATIARRGGGGGASGAGISAGPQNPRANAPTNGPQFHITINGATAADEQALARKLVQEIKRQRLLTS